MAKILSINMEESPENCPLMSSTQIINFLKDEWKPKQDKELQRLGSTSLGKHKQLVFRPVITVVQFLFGNYFLQTPDHWSSFQGCTLRAQIQLLLCSTPPKPLKAILAHSNFFDSFSSPNFSLKQARSWLQALGLILPRFQSESPLISSNCWEIKLSLLCLSNVAVVKN